VVVGLLAQDPLVAQLLAETPGATRFRVELDADPEALAADLLDVRRVDGGEPRQQVVAELGRALDQLLLDQDAQRLARHRRAQRVAAERRAVVAGLEHVHHVALGEHARDRVEAAGERLADDRDVGPDALVLEGEELAGPAEAGLDLVADQ